MEGYFCYNPLCVHHIKVTADTHNRGAYTRWTTDGWQEINNHRYADKDGVSMFFCDTCHMAISMTSLRPD